MQTDTRYRVMMRSTPGMYEQYEGDVYVWCHDEGDIFREAVRQLQRTSFPDRGADCWKLVEWEVAKAHATP